jgi:AcrR family transcriptional regulator
VRRGTVYDNSILQVYLLFLRKPPYSHYCNGYYNKPMTNMHATKQYIMDVAEHMFAVSGYSGFSIRHLAQQSGYGISSIYHFFPDKDELLKDIFNTVTARLGLARRQLPEPSNASQMLSDRILFQFHHAREIVFVLKYYLHFRNSLLI